MSLNYIDSVQSDLYDKQRIELLKNPKATLTTAWHASASVKVAKV